DNVPNRGVPQSVVVTPDGQSILTGTNAGLRHWDLGTGMEQAQVPLPLHDVRVLAVRPEDSLVAASGAGPDIVLFDWKAGRVRAILTASDGQSGSSINTLAFSPDGRQLLSAGSAGVIWLWDVESGKVVREFRGHTQEVFAAIFHPDGRRIISA